MEVHQQANDHQPNEAPAQNAAQGARHQAHLRAIAEGAQLVIHQAQEQAAIGHPMIPNDALQHPAVLIPPNDDEQIAIIRLEVLIDADCRKLQAHVASLLRLNVNDVESFNEYKRRILILASRIARCILRLLAGGNQVRDEDLVRSRLMNTIYAFIARDQLPSLPALRRAVNNAAIELVP